MQRSIFGLGLILAAGLASAQQQPLVQLGDQNWYQQLQLRTEQQRQEMQRQQQQQQLLLQMQQLQQQQQQMQQQQQQRYWQQQLQNR